MHWLVGSVGHNVANCSLSNMKMVQYPASGSLPILISELCCKPGRMSHSLAFGLSAVLGSKALKDVLKV